MTASKAPSPLPSEWLASQISLQNELAALRPLTSADGPALWQVAQDPALWLYALNRMETPADLDRYLAQALAERADGRAYPFVITHRPSGAVAGSTRFGNIALDHHRLEIGWTWIGTPWQRSGLNRAVKALLLSYAFEKLGVRRVEFKANARNERSRRGLEGIGASYEGCFRHHMLQENGQWRDTVYYSILADEWPQLKATIFAPWV